MSRTFRYGTEFMSYFSTSNFVDQSYNNRDHECPSNQPISDSNVDWQISKQLFSSEASSTLSTNNNLPTQHLQPTVFYGDFPPVLNNEENYENCRGTFSNQSCDVGNAVHLFPTFSQPDYMNCRTSSVPSSGSLVCEAENAWSVMENQPNELMLPSNSSSAFYTNNSSQQLFTSPISPVDVIDLTQSPRVDEQVKEQRTVKSHLHDGLDLNISNSNIMLHPTVKPTSDLGSELEAVTSEENIVDSPCFSSFSCLETFDYKNSPEKKMTYPSNDTDLSKFIDVPIKQNYQDNKPNETTPRIELANRELWQKFFEIGTEMIITKAGRRMFPAIKLEVVDLKPNSYYIMAVDITPVDNNRYRYVYHSSQWMAAGTTDAHPAPRTYIHPDSPCRGEVWMRQAITFDKLKLTNHEANKKGHIILNSMHKYQPRVHVIECHGNIPVNLTHFLPRNKRIDDVMLRDRTTAVFPECVFTTVTAYQNQQITKLKIDRNPFAKGFRETNKHWHNSSAESRVIQCQAKELERNRNEANPKFYNNSASYLGHTDDDSKSWQQSLSRDMDSNNIHFVDPGRDENVLLPMQHSYMEINSQYLDIDSETIPEVDDLDPEVLPEAESSFYDLLSDASNVET